MVIESFWCLIGGRANIALVTHTFWTSGTSKFWQLGGGYQPMGLQLVGLGTGSGCHWHGFPLFVADSCRWSKHPISSASGICHISNWDDWEMVVWVHRRPGGLVEESCEVFLEIVVAGIGTHVHTPAHVHMVNNHGMLCAQKHQTCGVIRTQLHLNALLHVWIIAQYLRSTDFKNPSNQRDADA